MTDPKTPDGTPSASEAFDAIAAADELAASLGDLHDEDADASASAAPAGDSFESILEQEVVQLNTLLETNAARIVELEDEIEKSRARIEKQSKVEAEQKTRKVLCEFLEVLDDLDRALAAARAAAHPAEVIEGVEIVRKSFLAALRTCRVEHVPCLGERFDPERHDAVSMVHVTDPEKNNVIIGVAQEGYSIGDEVLRPARVAVGKTG